jgi:hypothetical protein
MHRLGTKCTWPETRSNCTGGHLLPPMLRVCLHARRHPCANSSPIQFPCYLRQARGHSPPQTRSSPQPLHQPPPSQSLPRPSHLPPPSHSPPHPSHQLTPCQPVTKEHEYDGIYQLIHPLYRDSTVTVRMEDENFANHTNEDIPATLLLPDAITERTSPLQPFIQV